jgi:hypothetical protein
MTITETSDVTIHQFGRKTVRVYVNTSTVAIHIWVGEEVPSYADLGEIKLVWTGKGAL